MKSNHIKEKVLEEINAGLDKELNLIVPIQKAIDIHNFLSQKLNEYAMKVVKECLPEEKDLETITEKDLGWETITEKDREIKSEERGHNSARTQMLEKAKEMLNVK